MIGPNIDGNCRTSQFGWPCLQNIKTFRRQSKLKILFKLKHLFNHILFVCVRKMYFIKRKVHLINIKYMNLLREGSKTGTEPSTNFINDKKCCFVTL